MSAQIVVALSFAIYALGAAVVWGIIGKVEDDPGPEHALTVVFWPMFLLIVPLLPLLLVGRAIGRMIGGFFSNKGAA